MVSSVRSQAKVASGRQAAAEGQGTNQALGAGPGGKQGPCTAEQVAAPKGGQRAVRQQSYGPALLAAQSEAEAKGWREAGYLSTMRSRCRFFCLSWLFLPACNLRLV